MASLYAHGKNFMSRFVWLTPLMGGIAPTVKYLLEARGKPLKVGHAFYHGNAFEFRNCDSTAVKEVLVDKEYDFLSPFLRSCLKPLIIDVGAHIGTFSLWAYQQNSNAKMLMIEANPASYDILVKNVGKVFPASHFEALNRAAWRNEDNISFSTVGDSMGNKVSSNGDIKVKGITFAEIVAKASPNDAPIDLMKIDIEGAIKDGNIQ